MTRARMKWMAAKRIDMINSKARPVALTIAGFDPSGGAGVIADIKTFAAFGCYATAAVTSLTFQNTRGVAGAAHQTAETVRAEVMAIVQDFRVASVKTGMLPTREIILEVARLLRETELPAPVLDPVIRSTSGYDLIDNAALASLATELLPLSRVITPNIPEAERLTGLRITDEEGMGRAALQMREMGARAILIKGGHLRGAALDLLDNGGRVTVFRSERIEGDEVHGTGCVLASAIAACLGRGMALEDAVGRAKRFVEASIRHAPRLGHGARPIDPQSGDS